MTDNFWDSIFVQLSYLIRAIAFAILFLLAGNYLRSNPLKSRPAQLALVTLCYVLCFINTAITIEWFYNLVE